jgi:hypothetical protein
MRREEGDETMAEASNQNDKGRRCTIDLTPAASAEVDRICGIFELKIVDLFRYSLLLMRIYADAVREGKQMRLVSRKDPTEIQVVELPLFAGPATQEAGSGSGVESNAERARSVHA